MTSSTATTTSETTATATTAGGPATPFEIAAPRLPEGFLGNGRVAAAAEHDSSGEIDREAFAELREAGVLAALVPEELGGGGATHAEMCAILRAIAREDPAVALTLSMHSHLVAFQVWRHRHGQDASAVFGKVVDGAFLVSTGASDWLGSTGSAVAVDGGYRVTARKVPASGCEVGDVLVTSVRHETPEGAEVLHMSVPCSAEGVSIEQTWNTMGMRATGSHTVVLEDVFVPEGAVALRRPADVWHPVWSAIVGAAMPLIMSAYVGIGDAAMDEAARMLQGRDEAHVAQLLGEMMNAHTTAVDVVDAMVASSANLTFDNTDEHAARTLARKTVAADSLVECVRLGIEAVGGRAFMRSSTLERLYRDVHGAMFHPLPRAKQTTLSGRVALGLSPV